MNRLTITNGSRQVIASRNDESSQWNARVYVNHGETATLQAKKFSTEAGLRKWATKILAS